MKVMKPHRDVGIVGYGAYVPRYRLPGAEISRMWDGEQRCTPPIKEKAVPGLDEDVATMSLEAARNALKRAAIDPSRIRAVWVGSESHPYAVKPTSTIVAEAIGAVPHTLAADWQFACKAGTEAMQAALGFVGSGMADYAMAIGMDTAQGRPRDALEYTAGAGGAAFLVGPAEESIAVLEGSTSYVTDTADFWRRQHEHYPAHAGRFTGEPGLLSPRARRRVGDHGSAWTQTRRLCARRLPSAQHQISAQSGSRAGLREANSSRRGYWSTTSATPTRAPR
jgi:hydroxymethylglutaryl-CoA synthase